MPPWAARACAYVVCTTAVGRLVVKTCNGAGFTTKVTELISCVARLLPEPLVTLFPTTEMVSVRGRARSALVSSVVSWFLFTKLDARGAPLTRTLVLGLKSDPERVTVAFAVPDTALEGETEVTVGVLPLPASEISAHPTMSAAARIAEETELTLVMIILTLSSLKSKQRFAVSPRR